jgi:hypothetical protein
MRSKRSAAEPLCSRLQLYLTVSPRQKPVSAIVFQYNFTPADSDAVLLGRTAPHRVGSTPPGTSALPPSPSHLVGHVSHVQYDRFKFSG